MSDIDIQIYFSQFKTFFSENPKELRNLIGSASDEDFFKEVYSVILDNHQKGEPLELTQKQIIGIVLKLNHISKEMGEEKVMSIFQKTDFGVICLN